MRRQDEIRLLFPSQDQESQKLLLAELDGYAQAFDSEEVGDLLRSALGAHTARVRHQALATSCLFLPRHVARRMRVAEEEAGLWTEYQNDKARPDPETMEVLRTQRQRMRDKAADALVPAAEVLAARYKSFPEDLKPRAHLALAYLGSDSVLKSLSDAVQAAPTEAPPLWTWAFAGGGQRDPERLAAHLERYGVRAPEVLMAAAALPLDGLLTLAQRLEGRLDGAGTSNLAFAMSRHTGGAALPALNKLCKRTTGWGQVHVLRAAGASGHPLALELIRHIHVHSQNAFVRQQAIRAAGGLFAQAAIDFCLEQAQSGDPGSAAQALETLVRLRCPRTELATVARPHLQSTHLRTRVNAFLTCVDAHAQTLPRGFLELLEADSPLPRVEAAFCMGYWSHPACTQALAAMATTDPAPAARQQAIKSLSKHAPERSFGHLVQIVLAGGPAEALTATRVLARGAQQSKQALEAIVKAIPEAQEPGRHALLMRAAAALAAPEGDDALEALLSKDLTGDDTVVLAGALDAFKLLGGAREKSDRLQIARLAAHADPQVRGAAVAAGFLGGELSLLSKLEVGLKSDDRAALATGCDALQDLALIAREVVGPGHALLGSALDRSSSPSTAALGVPPPALATGAIAPPTPLRAEGEFDIDDGTPPPPQPRPSKQIAQPKEASDRDALLGELAARYQKKPGQKGDVAKDLQKDTYLVAGAAGKNLSAEPGTERLMRGVRQAGAIVRAHPVLLVPPVIFIFVVALMGRQMNQPELKPAGAQAVALHVMHAQGRAVVPGEPAALVPGDVLRFGEKLELDGKAALRLMTPAGDRLRVNGPARITITKGDARRLDLAVDSGSIDFVAAAGGALTVHSGNHTVMSDAGSFVAKFTDGHITVEARVPPVHVQTGSGTREEVHVGTPKNLD